MEKPNLSPDRLRLVNRIVDLAIDEDVGSGDATTRALFPVPGVAEGKFVARQAGVMAGGGVVALLYERLADRFARSAEPVAVAAVKKDGDAFAPGDVLLTVRGGADIILTGERTALNLLQHMCGVATRTRTFVDRIAGTRAKIYDTRKTAPGQRILDKMAVKAGGGENHRMGLYDMILVKDNHLAAHGGPAKAVRAARERSTLDIMVEVDTLEQLAEALPAEPDYVLLDNMSPERLAEAVKTTDRLTAANGWRRPKLEASGGVNLDTVAAVAASGVDRISVGQITNGVASIDIGLDF